jgi:hypothetical protein
MRYTYKYTIMDPEHLRATIYAIFLVSDRGV